MDSMFKDGPRDITYLAEDFFENEFKEKKEYIPPKGSLIGTKQIGEADYIKRKYTKRAK